MVVETLNVAGMVRNRRLARAIADSGMGQVRRMLAYKCRWAGGRLVEAGMFFASSKTCSGCGMVKAKLSLAERIFRCQACGLVVDRDVNAARNLAALVDGIRQIEPVAGSGSETLQTPVRGTVSPPVTVAGPAAPTSVGRQQEASKPSGCETGTVGW